MKGVFFILVFTLYTQTVKAQSLLDQAIHEIDSIKTSVKVKSDDKMLFFQLGYRHNTLAIVYLKTKQTEKSQSQLDSAKFYYTKAIEIDPFYFDALYSYGAMYYSTASGAIMGRNSLPLNSPEEYETLSKQINSDLNMALSYFVRAEKINPNHNLVLAAFRGIYGVVNKPELYRIFTERAQKLNEDPSIQFEAYGEHPDSIVIE